LSRDDSKLKKRIKKLEKQNSKPKKLMGDRVIFWATFLFGLILFAVIVASIIFFKEKIQSTEDVLDRTNIKQYEHYYVMITTNMAEDFRDNIYESALEEAKKNNSYIDLFGENLDGDYSKEDLLRMAVNMNVDGIVVEGDDTPEMSELINDATDKGIPVITIGEDSSKTNRNSFVGAGGYNIGREYGKQLCEYAIDNKINEKCDVLLLLDSAQSATNQSYIATSIQSKIEAENMSQYFNIETKAVNNHSFTVEEEIRGIFMERHSIPDIIVCLTEKNTLCTYSTIVEFNMVGKVEIFGYYLTPVIKKAIEKGNIKSTVVVDTEEMGKNVITALSDYWNNKYSSDMYPVDLNIVTKDNISSFMDEKGESENETK